MMHTGGETVTFEPDIVFTGGEVETFERGFEYENQNKERNASKGIAIESGTTRTDKTKNSKAGKNKS